MQIYLASATLHQRQVLLRCRLRNVFLHAQRAAAKNAEHLVTTLRGLVRNDAWQIGPVDLFLNPLEDVGVALERIVPEGLALVVAVTVVGVVALE